MIILLVYSSKNSFYFVIFFVKNVLFYTYRKIVIEYFEYLNLYLCPTVKFNSLIIDM